MQLLDSSNCSCRVLLTNCCLHDVVVTACSQSDRCCCLHLPSAPTQLLDHEKVFGREDIRGLQKNIIFLDHRCARVPCSVFLSFLSTTSSYQPFF